MKWAILADHAFAKLIDAWAALGGIEGQDEEMLTFEHPVMGVIDARSEAVYDVSAFPGASASPREYQQRAVASLRREMASIEKG